MKDNDYKDLINLMEATPKAPVPDNFTQNVMGRIALFNPSEAAVQSRWAQILSVSNPRECSFCFFITGFFYLIMGIVLMAGFKAIGSGIAVAEWIKLQPHLTIGAAMWLLALGMLLIVDGRIAIKIAQYGTLLYIFFTVVNGILMRPYLRVPHADFFIIGFVATGALMGVMLSLAVKKVEMRPV
ncbi:MAG: hypothetical protein KKD92_15065 [Proteobacteria bacterium]|nr:hypothetical protein [Pseudomonadota bacterium]MBU2623629.1 hypothetical protein [Pseudomonadota bacterium]